MTSIHRTAYPHFNSDQKIKVLELEGYYTLAEQELDYIRQNVRGDDLRLSFAVLLKVFQRLGYFPARNTIPTTVVDHIKKQLSFVNLNSVFHYEHESAVNRHRRRIYEYLHVIRWGKRENNVAGTPAHPGRHYAISIAYQSAQTIEVV